MNTPTKASRLLNAGFRATMSEGMKKLMGCTDEKPAVTTLLNPKVQRLMNPKLQKVSK